MNQSLNRKGAMMRNACWNIPCLCTLGIHIAMHALDQTVILNTQIENREYIYKINIKKILRWCHVIC